jgi:hypothetical protein
MASTRNINTPGNYKLEENQYYQSERYNLYKNSSSGEAYTQHLAGVGLLPGQVSWNQLTNNPVNTESFLFGINSTNLVNPAPIFVSDAKPITYTNLYQPNPTYMPIPLVIERNRPFPCP